MKTAISMSQYATLANRLASILNLNRIVALRGNCSVPLMVLGFLDWNSDIKARMPIKM